MFMTDDEIRKQMQANSEAWHTSDAETRKQLEAANKTLASQLSYGTTFDSSTGHWVDNSGNKLYEVAKPGGTVPEAVQLGAPANFTGSATGVTTYTADQDAILAQMNANSIAWHSASPEERERLHQENQQLAALLGRGVTFDGGYWSGTATTPNPVGTTTAGVPSFDYETLLGYKPTYTGQYDTKIDQMLDDILNREKFSYNAEEDPLYQQYRNQYIREGNRAMNDTLAAAASQAGGMNSYAMTAAQQANNYYSAQLNDKIPELYQLAYEMYLTDIDQQVRDLGLLQSMDDTQYGRYRDTMSDWRDDRNFAYDMYRDDMYDYQWNKDYDLNYDVSYGNLTGVIPSTGQNTLAKDEFEYTKEQDKITNDRNANNDAWNKAIDLLNAGSMPDASQLEAAGMSQDQANAIAALVKLGYDAEFDTSDTAWNRAMDLLGAGTMPSAEQLAAANMTEKQAADILAYVQAGYNMELYGSNGSGGHGGDVVTGTGLTGDLPAGLPEEEPEKEPVEEPVEEPDMWGEAQKLGIGPVNATTITDLAKYGGIVENADGSLSWANGWNQENWQKKLREARSSGFDMFQLPDFN